MDYFLVLLKDIFKDILLIESEEMVTKYSHHENHIN